MKKAVTGNAGLMRSINRNLIIETLLQEGSASRTELESTLGLALPTVMRIVDDLLEEGLVLEIGKGDSSGGRKPTIIQLNPQARYFIGVSIQRKLKVVLADAVGNIVQRYETIGKYDNIAEDILEQILEGIDDILSHSNIPESKIACIGIGTPGTLFNYNERIVECPFKNWAEFDTNIWKNSGRFKMPVEFENVAKLGALGELRFGHGRKEKNFVYIFADYGIGAGIVADGRLFRGTSGVSGELGHTIVQKDGEPCYCGSRGCLEMYSATPAIVCKLRRQVQDKQSSLLRAYSDGALDISKIISFVEQGDAFSRDVMASAGEMLGIGIGNIINIINPNMVIIGGELAESCPLYFESVKKSAYENIFSKRAESIPINISDLGNDSALLGAVALAMNCTYLQQ